MMTLLKHHVDQWQPELMRHQAICYRVSRYLFDTPPGRECTHFLYNQSRCVTALNSLSDELLGGSMIRTYGTRSHRITHGIHHSRAVFDHMPSQY
jgi:hypothetical protein